MKSQLGLVDNFGTFEWPKPKVLEALYARSVEETLHLSARGHAQAGVGISRAMDVYHRKVSMPEPVLDLAPLST